MKPNTKQLPPQFRDDKFRFCLVRRGEKRAYEVDWQIGRSHDDQVLNSLVYLKANYGVITGHGGMAILDIDCADGIARIAPLLPSTFTVKTSKGRHYYFIITGEAKKIILQDGAAHYGELQCGQWFYVVGPGSTHPSGVKYEIINNAPIATISYDEMKKVLAPLIKERVTTPTPTPNRGVTYNPDLRIEDVINIPSNPFQGPHPFHGSETGQNFTVDGDKWFCFRHNVGGGPLQLLAIREGIITCDQAGPGALRGDDFLETLGVIKEMRR